MELSQFALHNINKAAFINIINKVAKELNLKFELDSNDFHDMVSVGDDKNTESIFVPGNETEQNLIMVLMKKKLFSFPVKKINIKNMIEEINKTK